MFPRTAFQQVDVFGASVISAPPSVPPCLCDLSEARAGVRSFPTLGTFFLTCTTLATQVSEVRKCPPLASVSKDLGYQHSAPFPPHPKISVDSLLRFLCFLSCEPVSFRYTDEMIRAKLADFFIDLAKLIFAGVILGNVFSSEDASRSVSLILGIVATLVFVAIGCLILNGVAKNDS